MRPNLHVANLDLALAHDISQLRAHQMDCSNHPIAKAVSTSDQHSDWLPLAPNQRIIWFHERLDREAPTYNIGGYLRFPVWLDSDRARLAYRQLLQRHDALRLEVRTAPNGEPSQRFLEEVHADPLVVDFRGDAAAEEAAQKWMQRAMDHRFHFDRPPYANAALLLLPGSRSYFFLNCHHLLTDGWSFSLLTQDFCHLHDCLASGTTPGAAPPSYRLHVQEELAYEQSSSHQRDVAYWRQRLPVPPPPVFPARSRRNSESWAAAGKSLLKLPRAFYDQLENVVPDASVTTFHVLLAAVYFALAGQRSRSDMVIGTPILNRSGPVRRRIVGLFTGVVPVLCDTPPDASIRSSLVQLAATLRDAYRHRRFPLSEINRSAGLTASGRPQLFDVTLSFERHDYEVTLGGQAVETVPLTNSTTPLPLGIFVREFTRHADVQIELIHRTDRLASSEAEWLKQRIHLLLQLFLANPEAKVASLPLVCEAEQRQLAQWNETSRPIDSADTVLDLFDRWVRMTPTKPALVDGAGGEWSYERVNRESNHLAATIRSRAVGAGGTIGVCLDPGPPWVIAILAIMKSGCIYLPLSPQESEARLAGILTDAEVGVIIAEGASIQREAFRSLTLIQPAASNSSGQDMDATVLPSCAGLPAYCIFTSGSTGTPKGVRISHGGLSNFVLAMAQRCGLEAGDRVLQFSRATFDASIFEVFCTLCVGATLHIPPADRPVLPDRFLIDFLRKRQITHALLTPAVLSALPESDLPALRVLIAAGDTCPSELVTRWQRGRRFLNAYGPAECTVCATVHDCHPDEDRPPIGQPLSNVQVWVMDENQRQLPVGAIGEIVIGGAGVGLGYLNRPELNQRAFLDLPGHGRVYRTGDLGCWRPEGVIEHHGRRDRQVKIRGCLVAPGEVEAALHTHPDVRDAVVVAHGESPDQWLAAFVTRRFGRRRSVSIWLPGCPHS